MAFTHDVFERLHIFNDFVLPWFLFQVVRANKVSFT